MVKMQTMQAFVRLESRCLHCQLTSLLQIVTWKQVLNEEAEAIWEISSKLGVVFEQGKQEVVLTLMD
ncbi:hypothetical protein COLO4_26264 [Corchorus olitorius]|uniref:Uncharacterized protein n=1 Tax=Corchorus olitorius TaxID=93759 RepID=A0A1R3HXW5_9ROSI|nr:hypothetical protein COLO4_26264 [Corchorus olitorius]